MKITEVKVRLVGEQKDRLKAFCTVTFDEMFVVRDVKIIEGTSGLFLAMPSRKMADHCPKCHGKNHLKAQFCNDCGAALPHHHEPHEDEAASRLHVDVAHPITPACRAMLNEAALAAFEQEMERARHPDYVPPELAEEPKAETAADSERDDAPEGEPTEEEPRRFGAGLFG